LPSGETATAIDVPSLTVTSISGDVGMTAVCACEAHTRHVADRAADKAAARRTSAFTVPYEFIREIPSFAVRTQHLLPRPADGLSVYSKFRADAMRAEETKTAETGNLPLRPR
jgi:hypothetical protein